MTEIRCTTNLKYKNQSPKAVKYLYDKLLDIDKCDSMTRITFLFSLSHANHMSVIPSYYLYSLSFDRENLGGGRRKEDAKSFEYPHIEWSSQLARRKIAGHQKLVIFFMIESIKLCTGLPYAHNDFVFDLVRLFVRVLSSHSNVAWEKIEENWTDLFHLSKTQSNHSQSMSLTLWIFDEQIFDRKLPLPKCFTYS